MTRLGEIEEGALGSILAAKLKGAIALEEANRGEPGTPMARANAGPPVSSSAASIFTTTNAPSLSSSSATSSYVGASLRHCPHHGAKNSTRCGVGSSDDACASTDAWNAAGVINRAFAAASGNAAASANVASNSAGVDANRGRGRR